MSATPQQQFASRLNAALVAAGFSDSPTRLCRAFNAFTDSDQVSMPSVRKWIMGESIPAQGRLVDLSTMLGVDAHWLRYGEGRPVFHPAPLTAEQSELAAIVRALKPAQCSALVRFVRSMGCAV